MQASFRRQELWDDDRTWVYHNVSIRHPVYRTTLTRTRYEFVDT